MGSAAAAHLASRGLRVLGLEQFELGHDRGSSHGLTRIIRLAYFEHPSYVPLLRRAFELWRELERGCGERLLHVTGGLDVGWEGSVVFEGSLRSCREHDLPHDVLDAAALAARFPAWHPAAGARAVFQPDGGFLLPERCIAAHAARATAAGAVLHTGERLLEWHAGGGRVRVRTDRGRHEAGQLVLAGGAWMGRLAPALAALLAPERQMLGWFAVGDRARFAPGRFPVFVMDAAEGQFYGFPEFGVPGLKIGKYHHRDEPADPDALDRACHPADEAALRQAVARYFPAADGELVRSAACMFTNTPDEQFVIDRDPSAPEVLLLSPCSGHGFKFASVVGEIAADLVEGDTTRHDIALFRLARFADPRQHG
jgi:sarcosine oxidase